MSTTRTKSALEFLRERALERQDPIAQGILRMLEQGHVTASEAESLALQHYAEALDSTRREFTRHLERDCLGVIMSTPMKPDD